MRLPSEFGPNPGLSRTQALTLTVQPRVSSSGSHQQPATGKPIAILTFQDTKAIAVLHL